MSERPKRVIGKGPLSGGNLRFLMRHPDRMGYVEVGKISDLMTTGTDPEDSIKAPISI